jgi:hypothetical protein
MPEQLIRNGPCNILLILSDDGLDVAAMLSGLRSHYVLVCPTPTLGVEAVSWFEPEIVLIDALISDLSGFMAELSQAAGGRNMLFVAMTARQPETDSQPSGFSYNLAMPTTAGELEQLVWQISRDRPNCGPKSAIPPGIGTVG